MVHTNVGRKDNPRTSSCDLIEASDTAVTKSESEGNVKDDGKIGDPDYNEEQDRLYVFPPSRYHQGDVSLGVLMSG